MAISRANGLDWKDELVCKELQGQLDVRGLSVKKGTIQDATFIEDDPGKSKKLRGDNAEPFEAKTELGPRRHELLFGFKLHSKVDIDYGLIPYAETTTASLHDAPVALEQFKSQC
jgi:transposase, IS5 family